ncbi:MAG: hypothetical protein KDD04_06185 [Sinomicrobium sp.]|nr:hypothetical protein [Sinomicrobium sp.]
MEIVMKIDDRMLDEINLNHENPDTPESRKFNGLSASELPVSWTRFYALEKKSGRPLPKDRDSVRFLESVLVKFDTEGEMLTGFRMKISHANAEDLRRFSQLFRDMNPGKQADSQDNNALGIFDMQWDGEKLVIPTGEDPVFKELKNPERDTTTVRAKETLNFFRTAFRGANFVITYTFVFEGNIRKINGKHDFITQPDQHTAVLKIDLMEIMEAEAKGKTFEKPDETIVILID